MLRAWLVFRGQVLANADLRVPSEPVLGPAAAEATQGLYGVWRILATNNRELGRCAALHATPLDAFADATTTQAFAEELTPTLVRGSQPMTHGWVLRRDGTAIVTASRWYESASEAGAAARAARKVLGVATVVDGVSVGTHSGRRHRRAILPAEPLA